MYLKKILWVIVMAALAAALFFVIGFRNDLHDEVIFGGADGVFVDSGSIKDPLDGYSRTASDSEDGTDISEITDKYKSLSFPSIKIADWQYTYISARYPMKDYMPTVQTYFDGVTRVDERIIPNINQLLAAAYEAGFRPYVSLSYVSYADQQQRINEKITELMNSKGYSFEDARKLVTDRMEEPGTSEHQLGLAIDVTDKEYDEMDYSEMDAEFFKWLDENCSKYGFIKRYPEEKQDITGRYEPWHYRYVGISAAEFITENGLCLEEFIAHYEYQK